MACQRWLSMTFLHWAYEPAQVDALLPDGLDVDTRDGRAWVGLTPFVMADFSVGCLPPLPHLSTFPETNVRTYVRGSDGRDGLWFLSLDASSLFTVAGAWTGLGVPYRWAAMSVDGAEEGPTVRYRSRRRSRSAAGHRITVRPGSPFEPGELSPFDHWLTGRWRSYTRLGRRLASLPVEHQPWPLHHAEVDDLEESLLAAAGLPEPDDEPVVHYSPGVDVRLGPPRLV